MMYSYSFTIPGKPTPWKRMRRKGNVYFNEDAQENLKTAIASICKRADGFVFAPYRAPVVMTVHAVFELPQRIPKGDTRRMGSRHTFTPDADNIGKLIKDALNKVAYKDDCQVCDLILRKQWSDYSATNVMIELPEHIESYKQIGTDERNSNSAQTAPDHNANRGAKRL